MTEPGYGTGLAVEYDAARRAFDAIQLHYQVIGTDELMTAKRYVAIRLSDGGSDNTAYDSQDAAIRHQLVPDPNRVWYFRLPPMCPSMREVATLLGYMRRCYDAGYRPAGAHAGPEIILPNRREML
jgi:hypothetical protein